LAEDDRHDRGQPGGGGGAAAHALPAWLSAQAGYLDRGADRGCGQVLRGPLAPTPGGETIPEMLPDPTVAGTYADGAGGEVAAGSVPAWPTGADGAPLIRFDAALRGIHQPPDEGPGAAIERLKFNEAL